MPYRVPTLTPPVAPPAPWWDRYEILIPLTLAVCVGGFVLCCMLPLLLAFHGSSLVGKETDAVIAP